MNNAEQSTEVIEQPQEPAGAAAPAGTADAEQPSVVELLENRWRRAVAELDNTRKRYERQLNDQARAERAKTAAAFLPVLDNLNLALRHADADPSAIVAGVVAVHAQTVEVLRSLGFECVDPVGQRFDPARHEAARTVPAGDGVTPGTVVEVQRSGFVDAQGRLVRPAVVTVAQAADEEHAEEGRSGGDHDT